MGLFISKTRRRNCNETFGSSDCDQRPQIFSVGVFFATVVILFLAYILIVESRHVFLEKSEIEQFP